MKIIEDIKFNRLVADEGKHIRDINDIYIPGHYNERGDWEEEHIPYYFTLAYIPKKITEEMLDSLYIEESIL